MQDSAPARQMERARAIMHRLRAPGGCPWDAEQTHQSLIPNMIEEAYEAVDAIHRGNMADLCEELGDVLLQVLFHAEIAQENGGFTLDDVARTLSEKLIRRHPHIFTSQAQLTPDGVLSQWETIKRAEHGIPTTLPYLHDTGKGLPSLMRATKLQRKAAKVDFDWPDATGPLAKVREEATEVEEVLLSTPIDAQHLQEELGDLLFAVVNLCRKLHIDPESALASTNAKFEDRFTKMESSLQAQGISLVQAALPTMEAHWQQAKEHDLTP